MKIHKKLFYTGTVILTCLLTACQETPKEDIVKNKAESNLEDEVQQSTQADTEEASSTKISEQYPEQWTENWEEGDMVVDVQAEVHIPEVSEIVSKKVMPAVMSQEQAQEIEKYFFGDADAYYADNGVTKEDLQEEIIAIRQEIESLKNGTDDSAILQGDGDVSQQIEELQSQLKEDEKKYTAMDEQNTQPVDEVAFDSDDAIELQADLGKDETAKLYLYNDDDRGASINFVNYIEAENVVTADSTVGNTQGDNKTTENEADLNLSEEEAEDQAETLLNELQLGKHRVVKIEEKTQLLHGSRVGYYEISYSRDVDGMDNLYMEAAAEVQTDTGDSSEDDYMAHMEQENGRIQVDDSGIIGVQMDLPPQEISTVNENVQLMDFETVCRKFKENIGNRVYSASGATAHLEITNIYLTSMYVLNKGNSGEYLTVPVWDFCGYIYDEETPENAVYSMKQKDEENAYKVSYLTLNGIDGSVISRYNGY